jgi:ribonuclease-3
MTLAAGRDALCLTLGHDFARPDLLDEALTHRSAAAVGDKRRARNRGPLNYERLEFLGDRVLGLIVAEMLLASYPGESEGALARRLAELVRKESLAAVAQDIDLAAAIRLPIGEGANANILADVCEAVIAALYLDGGLETARGFVERHWRPRMNSAATPPKDPKTALQEWAQRRSTTLPVYRIVSTDGPPHQPLFTIEVEVAGHPPVRASGASKRLAEAAAAAGLLEHIGLETTP